MTPKVQHLWSLLPLALAVWASSILFSVLPQIMHDEYIYASQARNTPFELHPYSNYLFSWVMSGTKLCGTDFYGCTKGINTALFLIGVLFTLLIAAKFLTFNRAVFVASVTALSPLVIQTSFFMPETMYFTVMTISIWAALLASKRGTWWFWVVVGVSLGMAALVKPHAIFLVPALIVFAFLTEFRRTEGAIKRAWLSSTSVGVGFLVSKLGLGFLFAGRAGLRLFGGYGSPVERIANLPRDYTNAGAASESNLGVLETFLSVAGSHFLAHLAALALLAGIPLLLSLRVTLRILRSKEPTGDASAFFLLIALVTLSMLALVPTFEAYVTAIGDDHSLRLILRYYEFLIPIFLVATFMLNRFVDAGKASRLIQAISTSLLAVSFAVVYPMLVKTNFVDSSFLAGLDGSPVVLLLLALLISSSSIYWAIRPERGAQVLSLAAVPLVLIVSTFLSQDLLVRSSSIPAYFDIAGQTSGQLLSEAEGSEIVVVGQRRTEVFTVKFWIDKAWIEDYLLVGEPIYDLAQVGNNRFAVVLGDVQISGNYKVIGSGQGYLILEVLE